MLSQGLILTTVFSVLLVSLAYSQDESSPTIFEEVAWLHGPSIANMEDLAEIRIPGGYVFANGDDTRLLMDAYGNPPSNQEIGLFAPETMEWFAVFEFDEIGYVKDDEKSSLDTDAMLESIRKGTEETNKLRRERGFSGLHIIGWETLPHYDESTHNLEWAIKARNDSSELIVNHNTRILGRQGVMRVTLVVDPIKLSTILPTFRDHMNSFSYKPGQKYTEFREGDKIAEYGLTALVVGGAAAVAAKSGLLKYLWKIIVAAIVGIGAFLKRFLGKKSRE